MRIHYISPSIIPSISANSIHVINQCNAFCNYKHNVYLYSLSSKFGIKEKEIKEFYGIRSSLLKRSARSNVFIGKKQLLYDNKNMVITNLDKANQFLTRDYRSGWEI